MALDHFFRGSFDREDANRGYHSFKHRSTWTNRDTGEQGGSLMWGGQNPHPFAEVKGEDAAPFAEFIQAEFVGRYGVARADVCIDVQAPGSFKRIVRKSKGIVAKYRMAGMMIANDQETKGDTYYLGSEHSSNRMRVYEKDKQLAALYKLPIIRQSDEYRDTTRVELQVRPAKAADKVRAADMSPVDFLGVPAFCRELVEYMNGQRLTPVRLNVPKPTSLEKRLRGLMRMYGPTIAEAVAVHGPIEAARLIGIELPSEWPAKAP